MAPCFTNFFYRLCYGEWVLEQLNLKNSDGCDVYVMYDIACTLHKHLKVSVNGFTQLPFLELSLLQRAGKTKLVEKVKLCLPSFHSYGHSVSCQVKYYFHSAIIKLCCK